LENLKLALDESLTGKLMLAARLCRSLRTAMLVDEGLYSGQDTLLKILGDEDGQSMGSLAARLGVRPPTITRMVMRMSAQGFLRREPSQIDSRQFNVFLTQRGAEVIERIDKTWTRVEELAVAKLKEKDGKRLRKILEKILLQLDGHAGIALPSKEAGNNASNLARRG
jgi:MarR family transcriptional regulator, organic hydroperoxide resistance regulator